MDIDNNLLKKVVKFVIGESFTVCRLCLAEIKNPETISLKDKVKFDDDDDDVLLAEFRPRLPVSQPYLKDGITYDQMLLSLEVPKESSLPFLLCAQCAMLVTEAYLFQKLVEHSNKKWAEVLNKINNALDLSSRLPNNVNMAYLLMEETESHLFTNHNNSTSHTKKTILTNVRSFIRNRKLDTKVNLKNKPKTTPNSKICANSFPSNLQFSKHTVIKPETVQFQCHKCEKEFKNPWFLKYHKERRHNLKRIKCSVCAKMVGSERLLKVHTDFEHKTVLCQLCSIQLGSKKELKQHMLLHKPGKPSCNLCGKLYKCYKYVRLHQKYCGKVTERFQCAHCSMSYKRKSTLRSHLKVIHGFMSSTEAIHKCNWCNKKFDVISRLKEHIVTHTKKKNFCCESCGESFVTKAALTYHTRLHTGEKPYKCDMCDEWFLSASRRMEHKRRKHIGPERKCEECGRQFLSSTILRKHMARHTNPQSKLFLGKFIKSEVIVT